MAFLVYCMESIIEIEKRDEETMIYLQLFFSFLQIGAFSFGGGYAALPLIQNQVVAANHWMTMDEFTNLITISQMTPGPIAINSATFVGLQVAGIGGAIIATLGCILPSCILVSLIAFLYFKYKNLSIIKNVLVFLRPAVVAMIASAGLLIVTSAFWSEESSIGNWNTINGRAVVIFVLCVILLRKFKWNPILVMLLAGGTEILFSVVF